MATKPRILVAPLDWGLGHATRCVPIIETILQQGGEPVLASAGRAQAYLLAAFPNLEMIGLPSYNIHYYGNNMYWNIGVQGPKILRVAWLEHYRLQRLIQRRRIDAVISDNRFGCFSSLIPSIFVTHQVNLQIPYPWLRALANRLNHWFIQQYDECWVPDTTRANRLAGALSYGPLKSGPSNYRHIGLLSRLRPQKSTAKYDILALLSGPEPQRSHLEKMLLSQLAALPYRVLLVQGKPERKERLNLTPNMERVSYLNTEKLQLEMSQSALVICRSGYSTIMDLAAMGKKALLIPTPGQTEQAYLAQRMQQLGYCPYQWQGELDVGKGVIKAGAYPGFPEYEIGNMQLELGVQDLLALCKYT